MREKPQKIFDCLNEPEALVKIHAKYNNNMKKIDNIKSFLEVEELSKLEQGAIQGGAAEAKQKIRQKNDEDGTITQTNN